ncbi:MAG TPA: HNH endonuclease, partial [Ilumatobacteraceae bacterium]|nr:HNH endonuclease [Ilumatobacteraceae bacterium]
MQSEAILELVDRVAAAPVGGSRSALSEGFADVRRLRSWVEAQEIRLAAAAASVASFPEKFIAEATG